MQHDLRPDDRLGTENELATEFGVSRPTLREALRLLASSHLIRASRGPGGGVFVASTQNEGIGRNLSESIATMLETESISLVELVEARIQLEVPLAGLAASNATDETVAELEAALLVARVGPTVDGNTILRQHRSILRAIRSGQPAAAQRAMRRHLDYILERTLEVERGAR